MRTLIILKGLVKQHKKDWVRKEKLENYFLDFNVIKKMFSSPDFVGDHEILNRSYVDLAYSHYIEALCTRLSKGCLVVVDTDNEVHSATIEGLADIFGYKVFYVVQDIPQDYLSHPKKYSIPYYQLKSREVLEKEITNFLNLQFQDKTLITTFSDILVYWKNKLPNIKIKKDEKVLHVSDTHSNYQLYKRLPKLSKYSHVVFHGDYIDGPEVGGSRLIMDKVINSNANNITWLEGNHEIRLRRYLGYIIFTGRTEIQNILLKTLPQEFIDTTAKEFSDLSSTDAKDYLDQMNNKLKMFVIIDTTTDTYICTHSGLRYVEQLDPRYIGNVIYGHRNMNKYDKEFSVRGKKNNLWSIHAHCKYPDKWEVNRYTNTLNIDPEDENKVVCAEQCNGNWKIWQLQRNLN